MKTCFNFQVLAVLAAAAIAGAVGQRGRAAEVTASITQNSDALPDNIQPGTPTAQVIKLVRSGVETNVIQTYINDCPSAFNLDANKIIVLSDLGVPGDMINSMITHDKNFLASLPMSAQPATASSETHPESNDSNATESATPPTAPAEPVTVQYFYNELAPYGSWVNVDGYGLCWRPTVVVYNSAWRPYCDRGHWVYTDYGWYWDSDYAWGITFHYGRWFHNARYGWCWWPNTVWAPSWVTWRSSADYCGWAPLPPFSAYLPGIGFTYHGRNVSLSFGFGLAASYFTFVPASHFCAPHPRYYCAPRHELEHLYGRTTVHNNFGWHNRRIINHGVSVSIIGRATRHPIRAVSIGSLVNVNRPGWPSRHAWHPSHPTGTFHSTRPESRHPGYNDHRQNTFPHNGNENRQHNDRPGSFKSAPPMENHRDNDRNRGHRDSSMINHPDRNQRHDVRFANRGNHPQIGSPYPYQARTLRPTTDNRRQPVITTTPPKRSKPHIVPTRIVHNTPSHFNSRGPRERMNRPHSYSGPTITIGQPRRSSPRNNLVQPTPHLVQRTPHIIQPTRNIVQRTPHIVQPVPHRIPSAVSTAPAPRHYEKSRAHNNGQHQGRMTRGGHH